VYGISWFNGWLPLWVIVEWVGVVVAAIFFLTTKNRQLPVYNNVRERERERMGWCYD